MITIYDWFGFDIPSISRYKLIKEVGFDGVLLWWSNGFGRDRYEWNEYRKAPHIAREAGLYIENIHAPVETQNDLSSDNLDGESLFSQYLDCITDCSVNEIPTMVVHLPNDKYPLGQIGLNRVKRLVEKAERHNVNIALENLNNLENVKNALQQVESNRLGFCYDCAHHFRRAPDEDLLSMYGNRLMAIHLHDNNGAHAEHGLPFDGTLEWKQIMKDLDRVKYKGAIAIEAMNWEYENLTVRNFLEIAYERALILKEMKKSV